MEVIDHQPQAWYLFQEGDALFLDVNCNHGAFGYSVLVQLNETERGDYAARGRVSLSELSEAIHHSAPGARDSTSAYKERDLCSLRGEDADLAIAVWSGPGNA